METSPSFKQALRMVIKRNVVRLALLFILLAVWWAVIGFRSGDQFAIAPKTLAKVSLARVQSPTRLLFTLDNPKEKKMVEAELLALDTTGFPEAVKQHCSEELLKHLENQTVWIRSVYLASDQHTVGRVMISHAGVAPDDVGISVVQSGCAFYCKRDEKYLSPEIQKLYQTAQEQAQKGRLGVWADPAAKPSDECLKSL
ncbi:MAG: thermonuclease family protein [Bdellovibrionia bacterium]